MFRWSCNLFANENQHKPACGCLQGSRPDSSRSLPSAAFKFLQILLQSSPTDSRLNTIVFIDFPSMDLRQEPRQFLERFGKEFLEYVFNKRFLFLCGGGRVQWGLLHRKCFECSNLQISLVCCRLLAFAGGLRTLHVFLFLVSLFSLSAFFQGRIQDFAQGGPVEFWPQGGLSPKFAQNRDFPLKLAWKLHDFEQFLGVRGHGSPGPPGSASDYSSTLPLFLQGWCRFTDTRTSAQWGRSTDNYSTCWATSMLRSPWLCPSWLSSSSTGEWAQLNTIVEFLRALGSQPGVSVWQYTLVG